MATAKKAIPKRVSALKDTPLVIGVRLDNEKGLTPAEKIIDILNGLNANEQNCVIKEVLIKVRSDRHAAIDASNKDLEWQRSLMEAFFSLTKEALS